MLYAIRYVKRAGEPGATVQEYLDSFPVNKTAVPVQFDTLLRQATVGRPDRYKELLQKIEERALAPARKKAAAEAQKSAWTLLSEHLEVVASQFEMARALPFYDHHVKHPAIQIMVKHIAEQASSAVLVAPVPQDTDIQVQRSETQALADAAGEIPPEERLQALLLQLGQTCDEIAGLMPEAARHFRRGHKFETATSELVKQAWFKTSDAIAALGGRSQLRRPKKWEHLRTTPTVAPAEVPVPAAP